jgi:cytochrome c556
MPRSLALLTLALVVLAAGAARPKPSVRRAAPPATWDKTVAALFAADAFTLLDGQRPADFGRPTPAAATPAAGTENATEKGDAVADGDFDRRDMMKKLEGAETSLAELMASEKSFKVGGSKIDQTTDLVIMMGRTLFNNDPDYADDDTYLKHAEDMTNYAKQLKNLSKKEDYAGAGAVFGKMRTTCNACHEGYR